MKTQELKDLFKNAQSANDVIEIFNSNPGLEDEILELGKKEGVDLSETKELSEFELELVAGGLSLKQGVVTTMATLMVATSIVGPLGTVQKAYGAENQEATGVEQVADDVNLGTASATSQVNAQADQTEEVQNLIKDSESKAAEAKDSVKVEKDSIGIGAEQATYEGTSYNPQMEDETTSADPLSIYVNAVKEGGAGAFEKFCESVPAPVLGAAIGQAGSSFFKDLFGLGDGVNEDAKTRNLIKENTKVILDNNDASTKAIMQNSNNNTFKIMSFMDNEFNKVEKKIDALQYKNALSTFDSCLNNINNIIETSSLSEALDIVNSGNQEKYQLEKSWIKGAFADAYNPKTKNNSPLTLYNSFVSASNIIIGENIDSQNVNFMDLKKMTIEASGENMLDSESVEARRDYLNRVAKKYLSEYVQVYSIINYEYLTNMQNYAREYIAKDAEVQGLSKEDYAGMTFEQFESKFYRSDTEKDGKIIEGVDFKYRNAINDSRQDLDTITQLYNKALEQIKVEFAKLNFETSEINDGIYVIDNVAYTLGDVVDSDNYNFTLDSGDGKTCNANDDLETICSLCSKDSNWYGTIVDSFNAGSHQSIPGWDEYSQTAAETHKNNLEKAGEHVTDMGKNLVARCNPNAAKKVTTIDANVASKLIKYYSDLAKDDKTMTQLDGIFTYEDELSQTSLENFHREFEYKILWGAFTLSYGCNASKGFQLTKQLHYISADSGSVGKIVESSRRLDFKNDSNTIVSTGNSKKLGVFKDVTQDYYTRLIAAVEKDTGINISNDVVAKTHITLNVNGVDATQDSANSNDS